MKLQNLAAFTALFILISVLPACSSLNSNGNNSNSAQKNSAEPSNSTQKNSGEPSKNEVKTADNPVDQLVALCKDDNYKEAAKNMRYPGTDKSKKDLTADYESGDAEEKRQVEMSCKRFKAMSDMKYTVSPERMEQGFYVYDVEANVGGKSDKQLWAFKKTDGNYILVDID